MRVNTNQLVATFSTQFPQVPRRVSTVSHRVIHRHAAERSLGGGGGDYCWEISHRHSSEVRSIRVDRAPRFPATG
ncbi:hypothetical protein ACFPRL_16555 [Pseudoclavibacter helvolus]